MHARARIEDEHDTERPPGGLTRRLDVKVGDPGAVLGYPDVAGLERAAVGEREDERPGREHRPVHPRQPQAGGFRGAGEGDEEEERGCDGRCEK